MKKPLNIDGDFDEVLKTLMGVNDSDCIQVLKHNKIQKLFHSHRQPFREKYPSDDNAAWVAHLTESKSEVDRHRKKLIEIHPKFPDSFICFEANNDILMELFMEAVQEDYVCNVYPDSEAFSKFRHCTYLFFFKLL